MFDSMKQLPQFIKLLTNLRKTLSDRGILLVVCFLSFTFWVSTFFGCFAFWWVMHVFLAVEIRHRGAPEPTSLMFWLIRKCICYQWMSAFDRGIKRNSLDVGSVQHHVLFSELLEAAWKAQPELPGVHLSPWAAGGGERLLWRQQNSGGEKEKAAEHAADKCAPRHRLSHSDAESGVFPKWLARVLSASR